MREEAFGWRFVTPLALGSTLNAVNSSMIATALVPIGHYLGIPPAETVVLVACLYVACSVAQPTMGRLGALFGPRRVFVSGTVLVGVGATVGALATNLALLIAARILIGIGTSAAYPSAMLLIRRRHADHPEATPGGALGLLTVSAQVTAAAGLPLGGILVHYLGWRAIFAANLPGVLLCLAMTLLWIPRDRDRRPAQVVRSLMSLDPLGILLFASTVSLLLMVLQQIPDLATAPAIGVLAGAAALVAWEWRAQTPFIHIRGMLHYRALSATYLRTCLCYSVTYAVLYGFTLWLQEDRGVSDAVASLIVLPMSLLAAPIAYIIARTGQIWWPLIGCAAAFVATGTSFVLADSQTPLVLLTLAAAFTGVALGLMSAGNQTALYRQSPPESIGASAGTYRTFIYLGAILSSGFTDVVYSPGVDERGLTLLGMSIIASGLILFLLAGRHLRPYNPPQDVVAPHPV